MAADVDRLQRRVRSLEATLRALADLAERDAQRVAGDRSATLDTLLAIARRARRAAYGLPGAVVGRES